LDSKPSIFLAAKFEKGDAEKKLLRVEANVLCIMKGFPHFSKVYCFVHQENYDV
jgi:predicted Ser/Thr protein kinase